MHYWHFDATIYSNMNEVHANHFVKDVASPQDPCPPEPPMHTIVACTLHFSINVSSRRRLFYPVWWHSKQTVSSVSNKLKLSKTCILMECKVLYLIKNLKNFDVCELMAKYN
jgi:hypothetical protein